MTTDITDDLAPEILAALQSIDDKLGRIPTTLLDEERRARKKAQRVLAVAVSLVAVLVLVVAAIFVQRERDRTATTRESRCAIHVAVAGVIDVSLGDHKPTPAEVAFSNRVLARIRRDLPANCPNGG